MTAENGAIGRQPSRPEQLRALAVNALTATRVAPLTEPPGVARAARARADVGEERDRLTLALDAVTPAVCGCPDCLHAAGALAYLVDLLDYATRHLLENGQPVDVERLSERFHQPFAGLRASCEAVETPVLQARIAVEVLRSFLSEAAEPDWYLQAAYEALLRAIGTSLDELRAARSAPPRERVALAARIGILIAPRRPPGGTDQLDQLLDPMAGLARSEDGLEQLFGLRATRRPPLDGDVLPGCLMAAWRHERVRRSWTDEDHPAGTPTDTPPLIDPDQLGPSDFVDLSSAAFQIFSRRHNELGVLRATKKDLREQFGLNAVLGDRFTSGLLRNTSQAEVISFADRRARGDDVAAEVAGLGLGLAEFDRLAAMTRLDDAGDPVTDDEWEDVYAIFVALEKRGRYTTWRAEEEQRPSWMDPSTPGSFPLLIDPAVFRVRSTPAAGGVAWRPLRWRSDTAARRRWERTVRLRGEQEMAILGDLRAAVAGVEQTVVPRLRDWLLGQVVSPIVPPATRDRVDWLTRRLGIDFKAGSCVVTTRVAQAITAVQSAIFGARHGLLEELSLTLDAPFFDEEWAWLGSYASWRAAMLVFLYPENTLRPTLRRAMSPAFTRLVRRFPTWAAVDAAGAQAAADEYAEYFADVCSLSLAGEMERAQASPPLARRVVRLARAAESGRLYASAYTQLRRPSNTPGQPPVEAGITAESFWDEVPGIPRAADVIGMTVFRGAASAPARIGVYVRWLDGQAQRHRFTSTDGSQWQRTPLELAGPPGLVRVGGLTAGAVPGAQPLLADLDGSGRPQVVTMAAPDAAGRRLLQVLVESDGGLAVQDTLLLEAGFELSLSPRAAVFRRGRRDRLLVIDRAGGRIGLVGRDESTGNLRLLSSTTDVRRANGMSGWPVVFGTAEDPTVFVSANLDGSGIQLLAFERMATSDPYSPVGTSVAVCDLIRDTFVFRTQQVFQFHLPAREPGASGFDVRWDGFVPIASGYGLQSYEGGGRQDILVTTVRTTHWPTSSNARPPANEETRAWLRLLRWDRTASAFVTVPDTIAWGPSRNAPHLYQAQRDIPGVGPTAAWPLSIDDEFLPIDLGSGAARSQSILVRSRSRGAVGVLTYTGVTTLGVTYHAQGSVDTWALAPDQSFAVADIDGDGRDELLAADPTRGELALLAFSRDPLPSVGVVTQAAGRVETPDQDATFAWTIGADAVYVAGDVDGDGRDEIVVRGAFGRMAVLRTVAPPQIEGRTRPVCPQGVSLLRIEPKRSVADLDVRKSQIRQAYDATLPASGERSLEVAILDEAYYFVHIELGLELYTAGAFGTALDWFAATYDYVRPVAYRKIADKLVREEAPLSSTLTHAADWLADPLDPHAIAATRPNAYSRFTILAVVRCLLGWADAEFTRDNEESVARARELYLAALDLLGAPELAQRLPGCSDLVRRIVLEADDPEMEGFLEEIRSALGELTWRAEVEAAVGRIEEAWDGEDDPIARIAAARRIAVEAVADERPLTLAEVLERDREVLDEAVAAVAEANLGVDPAPVHADALRMSATFCVPPDSAADALRRHAELALRRIRSCRTMSGLRATRGLSALTAAQFMAGETGSGAPLPFQPLPYRYATLVERARQLVQLAAQIEASMLDAIQEGQAAAYDELRARQDLALQGAGVRLKELAAKRVDDAAGLAALQRDRAVAHREYLTVLYDREYSAGTAKMVVGWVNIVFEFIKLAAGGSAGGGAGAGGAGAGAGGAGGGFSSLGGFAGAGIDWIKTYFEIRDRLRTIKDQQAFADREVEIGQQQVLIAGDDVALAQQDWAVARLRADHAEAVVEFLVQRFAGAELYDWMSGVLQDVYRFFLQQATSMARLAEAQLAFERQELVPRFVQDDYWSSTRTILGSDAAPSPDRRGLTGSARLLRDLVSLDEYAFRTAQRKLQLSRTLSLAMMDPLAFERFRRTGVLHFATPTSLFDRDFPGHYLRLVNRVRVAVFSRDPLVEGIRAMLATTGTSYVVVGVQDRFQRVVVQRGPETIALTAPSGGTGVLEPEQRSGLLVPFESIGVDTTWRFSMPRPANPYDFAGIADVWVTIDYSALDSVDLRRQVIAGLDPQLRYERAYSFRHDLKEQWEALHDPAATATPVEVKLRTERRHFAPNVDGHLLRHVTLAYLPVGSSVPSGWTTALRTELSFAPDGAAPVLVGGAEPVEGIITTRPGFGNAPGWQQLTSGAVSPVGSWTLQLAATARVVFVGDEVDDVLLLLSYEGTSSPWPEED
jgi:hypothetical protein